MAQIRKMNICLISAEYPPETLNGGIGTYTFSLAHGLVNLGHKVTVISKALDKEQEYFDQQVHIYRIFDKRIIPKFTRLGNLATGGAFGAWQHSLSVFSKLKQIISRNGEFDVVEGPLWGAECFAYSINLNMPLVVRLQTPIFKQREILGLPANPFMEFMEKASLQKATLVASISQNITGLIVKRYGISDKKILYSPLGVVFPNIKNLKTRTNSPRLLFVGRLEKRKGIQELIDSLPKILSVNLRITVDIVGKDCFQAPGNTSYLKYFQRVVPAELQERVKFHGFVENKKLQVFYRDCDVFIAPSRYESFGLIFLEAMVFGKPVIGTKVGGIPEIIKDGQNGLLIDVNEPDQIANAVLRLFSDSDLRKKIGLQAFRDTKDNFSVEKMAQESAKIYEKAIADFKTAKNVNKINLNQLKLKKGDKVLDIGCSFGDQAIRIAKQGLSVYGIDKSEQAIRQFRESAEGENVKCVAVVGDIEKMPYEDNQFDAVVATEVFEHVTEPEKAIKESARVLRSGGHACVSVPTQSSEKIFRFLHPTWVKDSTHVNVFSKGQILALLKQAGFTVEKVENQNFEWSIFWLIHSILKSRFKSSGTPLENHRVSEYYFRVWDYIRKFKLEKFLLWLGNNILPKSYYIYVVKD